MIDKYLRHRKFSKLHFVVCSWRSPPSEKGDALLLGSYHHRWGICGVQLHNTICSR